MISDTVQSAIYFGIIGVCAGVCSLYGYMLVVL